MGTHFETHIFLTHFHMDHIQGLGFFKPFFIHGLKIHLWGPPILGESMRSNIGRYLSPPLFPVHVRDIPCDLTLSDVPREDITIGDFTVRSDFVCHPGPTLGYRISRNNRSVTYIPDHEPYIGAVNFPNDGEWTSGFDLAHRADLLIHDAQFTPQEYEAKVGWGHSSIQHTIEFAKLAEVSRLDLFHYDPASTDADLEELYVRYVDESLPFDVYLAKEGQNVVL
jgi:ribonuclease BN (tRNA processing enzyme)